ncbi:putative ribonuclease H-like domain-containing protein, partial [Tanacetum coccineum]
TGDGPKWLFDLDSLTKSMNYVPVVAGTNSNGFAGSEESNGAGHTSKETEFSQDYIVMPLWKDGLMFDYSSKNSCDDEPQPSSNAKHKDDKGVSKVSGFSDPESSTPNINTVSPTVITTSNLTTSYQVPTTPNTRIQKDHSLDHVIGDIQSGVQTRGMAKNINKHGFISAIYEGKTHEDLHTCLFACFISQEEPKRIAKALSNPTWVESMQEELLQFKLQKVWILVGLPKDLDHPDKVYKVVKALYGLHQALRAWYGTLAKYLLVNGFQREKIDQTLFIKNQKGDILLMSSMGELNFFLGLKVKQREYGIFISQDKYVAEILRKFGFTDVKTASTPMDTENPLHKDSDVDVHLYRSMIGSLMYLTSSRPDIMFVVCACARFQVTPKVSHSYAVKRIFRYLKGQPKLGL